MASKLEIHFGRLWQLLGPGSAIPYATEVPLAAAGVATARLWRFDVAFADERVAVEIEGGIFKGGRHQRIDGYTNDCDKYNAAQCDGWLVLRFCSIHFDRRPFEVVETVLVALANRGNARALAALPEFRARIPPRPAAIAGKIHAAAGVKITTTRIRLTKGRRRR
jgi:hypothetical protein